MSQENVEVVRRSIDVFNAFMRYERSAEAVAKLADPQIEFWWHEGRTVPDSPEQIRGAAELIGTWIQLRSALSDVTWEPLEFIEASEDRVLVPIRLSARGRESGAALERDFFTLWMIRGINVQKMEFFRHRADALQAAGLRE
jgi:ketosteroid isomerase-like protein